MPRLRPSLMRLRASGDMGMPGGLPPFCPFAREAFAFASLFIEPRTRAASERSEGDPVRNRRATPFGSFMH